MHSRISYGSACFTLLTDARFFAAMTDTNDICHNYSLPLRRAFKAAIFDIHTLHGSVIGKRFDRSQFGKILYGCHAVLFFKRPVKGLTADESVFFRLRVDGKFRSVMLHKHFQSALIYKIAEVHFKFAVQGNRQIVLIVSELRGKRAECYIATQIGVYIIDALAQHIVAVFLYVGHYGNKLQIIDGNIEYLVQLTAKFDRRSIDIVAYPEYKFGKSFGSFAVAYNGIERTFVPYAVEIDIQHTRRDEQRIVISAVRDRVRNSRRDKHNVAVFGTKFPAVYNGIYVIARTTLYLDAFMQVRFPMKVMHKKIDILHIAIVLVIQHLLTCTFVTNSTVFVIEF